MCSRIALPGLKPSSALYGAGLIGVLLRLTGIAAWGRFRRRPVRLCLSGTVSRLSGNGNRQGVLVYGRHVVEVAACAHGAASSDRLRTAATARAATRTGSASLNAAGPRRALPNISLSSERRRDRHRLPPTRRNYIPVL